MRKQTAVFDKADSGTESQWGGAVLPAYRFICNFISKYFSKAFTSSGRYASGTRVVLSLTGNFNLQPRNGACS